MRVTLTTPAYNATQGMHLLVTMADGSVVRDETLPPLGAGGTLNLDIPEGVPLAAEEPEMDMRTSSYPINGDRIRQLEAERDGWHESYKKRGKAMDQMQAEIRHWKALVERHEQALGKFIALAREVQT